MYHIALRLPWNQQESLTEIAKTLSLSLFNDDDSIFEFAPSLWYIPNVSALILSDLPQKCYLATFREYKSLFDP